MISRYSSDNVCDTTVLILLIHDLIFIQARSKILLTSADAELENIAQYPEVERILLH